MGAHDHDRIEIGLSHSRNRELKQTSFMSDHTNGMTSRDRELWEAYCSELQ